MAEVTPELLSRLEQYLKERSRGETTLLLSFYKEVFGREVNTNCGGCIEDAAGHLKRFMDKKKTAAVNYKWVGPDNATVIIRTPTVRATVSKANFTDEYGEIIAGIAKYAHNVEYIGKDEPFVVNPALKKKEEDFTQVSQDTTSTLTTAQTGPQRVKGKKGKRR